MFISSHHVKNLLPEPRSIYRAAVALSPLTDVHGGINCHQDIQGWRDGVEEEIGEGEGRQREDYGGLQHKLSF